MKRLLIILAMSSPFAAHAYTAQQLYDWCNADMQINPSEAGLCIGYVAGVWHTTTFVESLSEEQTLGICVPREAKVAHIKDMFVQWARVNPQKRSWEASDVITVLLRQNFPCN